MRIYGYKNGLFVSLPRLAAFLSMSVAGWISDGFVKKGFTTGKARVALICTVVRAMAVCLLLATQAINAYTAIELIDITMMFAVLNFPSFWSLSLDMHAQKSRLISDMINTRSGLASILAPGITGCGDAVGSGCRSEPGVCLDDSFSYRDLAMLYPRRMRRKLKIKTLFHPCSSYISCWLRSYIWNRKIWKRAEFMYLCWHGNISKTKLGNILLSWRKMESAKGESFILLLKRFGSLSVQDVILWLA